jgi:RNA polymerase sigma-70 factor (ECF subfamily)
MSTGPSNPLMAGAADPAPVGTGAARSRATALIGPEFERILRAAKEGDEQAFAGLYRVLNPPVLRYLRVFVPAGAEDVASDAWLEVVRGLGRFEGDESGFRAWLFTIARNRGLDWLRKARRTVVVVPIDDLFEQPGDNDPADQVLLSAATEQALALISRLSPNQAEVVALRVIAGLEVEQVARIMDKRPGTVRVLGHRGLRKLAELIGPDLPERRSRTDAEQADR